MLNEERPPSVRAQLKTALAARDRGNATAIVVGPELGRGVYKYRRRFQLIARQIGVGGKLGTEKEGKR